MYISQMIERYLSDISYQAVNEQEVLSFGLLSCDGERLGAFVLNQKFAHHIQDNIVMVITNPDLKDEVGITDHRGLILTEKPQELFWKLHKLMEKEPEYVRTSFPSSIAPTAKIGKYVSIPEENVIIEDGVVIEDFVTIYEHSHIKEHAIIRSGSRIGGVGYQEYKVGRQIETVNHYGGTVIGRYVDIQNNSCVDRALFPWENTVIGDYTKLDNLVHIAHAVRMGEACMCAAGVVIAGRCEIGNEVWIGLGASVRNLIKIGDNSRVNIGSVVVDHVEAGQSVSGNYAIDHNRFLYQQLKLRKL